MGSSGQKSVRIWSAAPAVLMAISQSSHQRVPAFVSSRRRLFLQQRELNVGGLQPVLFEELPHQLPADLWLIGPREAAARSAQVIGRYPLTAGPPLPGNPFDRAYGVA